MKRWYHVSHTWKGDTVKVEPKRQTRVPGEPETARICVCPTPEECFLAIGVYEDIIETCDVSIYVTESNEAIPANGVGDSHITREHWLTKAHTFKRVKTFKRGTLNLPSSPSPMMKVEKLAKLAPKLLDMIEDAIS